MNETLSQILVFVCVIIVFSFLFYVLGRCGIHRRGTAGTGVDNNRAEENQRRTESDIATARSDIAEARDDNKQLGEGCNRAEKLINRAEEIINAHHVDK